MLSFPKVAKMAIMNIALGDSPCDDSKFKMKNDALFFPDFCSSTWHGAGVLCANIGLFQYQS